MSAGDRDFEVLASIAALYKIASRNHPGDVDMSPIEVRIRATLALAVFLPHPEARKYLIHLMASSEVPKEVRSVASHALTGGETE
jgi:hypothetical protein